MHVPRLRRYSQFAQLHGAQNKNKSLFSATGYTGLSIRYGQYSVYYIHRKQ